MATPALDKTSDAWKDADKERAFWLANYHEFAERYRGLFVAVRDGGVVATSDDLRDLLATLTAQKLKPTDTWIQFFESEPRAMML